MKAKNKEQPDAAGAETGGSPSPVEAGMTPRPADSDEVKWRVRAEDGSVFGPAAMSARLVWARDGRLSPRHLVSSDGENWVPVTSLGELSMDWVAEVSPGRFYGPIHHDAVVDLIRTQTIAPDIPKFVRVASLDESPASLRAENDSLRRQLAALREDFSRRAADLEASVSAAEALQAELRGQLETRDMDFEAERQSFKAVESSLRADLAKAEAERQEAAATESRLRADLAKAEAERQEAAATESRLRAAVAKLESRVSALAKQVEQASGRERAHAADSARIAELEKILEENEAERRRLREEFEAREADARRGVREAEAALLKERDDLARLRTEAQSALDRAKNARVREESVCKLLRQALSAFDHEDDDTIIEDGEAILLADGGDAAPRPLPPRPDLVLNAIEAQAQRELKKLKNNPFPKK
jgi:DNA repair exonuclease SbcCD ATPase subunit